MTRSFCIILFIISGLTCNLYSQTKPPFWDEIETFKKQDSISPPVSNPILFVGSSSIRMWVDLEKIFEEHSVLNRGFGGSVINDVIFYADDVIFQYKPRQVFLYIGENDLPENNITADIIFSRFKSLYELLRAKLPGISIVYISIKPSPVRAQYFATAKQTNYLISSYLKNEKYTNFIDVYSLMLTKQGNPRPELFLEDMLHMNDKGYSIWRKAVKPYLIKK